MRRDDIIFKKNTGCKRRVKKKKNNIHIKCNTSSPEDDGEVWRRPPPHKADWSGRGREGAGLVAVFSPERSGGWVEGGRAHRSARMPIMNHIDFHVAPEISSRGSESVHLHALKMRRRGRMVVAAVKAGYLGTKEEN